MTGAGELVEGGVDAGLQREESRAERIRGKLK